MQQFVACTCCRKMAGDALPLVERLTGGDRPAQSGVAQLEDEWARFTTEEALDVLMVRRACDRKTVLGAFDVRFATDGYTLKQS